LALRALDYAKSKIQTQISDVEEKLAGDEPLILVKYVEMYGMLAWRMAGWNASKLKRSSYEVASISNLE